MFGRWGVAVMVVGRGFPKEYFEVDPNNYKETVDEDFVSDVATRLQHRFPPFVGATRIDSYGALVRCHPGLVPLHRATRRPFRLLRRLRR